ncbi:MAG TPA: mechanosensitive ion channel family protein [Bacillota bacterium]
MTYLNQHPEVSLILRRGLAAVIAIAAGWLLIRLGNLSVRRLLVDRGRRRAYLDERRARTLASLLRSVSRYVIDFVVLLTVLGLFNVPVASVLALSGFIGLAVGFGAQNLVKDFIAGFFILFEDEFAVGEVIRTAGLTGTVEEIGLRTTRLRDPGGQVHTIPNGLVDKVTNLTRGERRASIEVPVPYGEDSERVLAALNEAVDLVKGGNPEIKSGPGVLGLTAFGPSAIIYTIEATTSANAQWRVERELRLSVRRTFATRGINMTAPASPGLLSPGTPGQGGQGRPEEGKSQ